ncbi:MULTISPECIES: D-alanyl-D-alanine carboxypeptidase/D-alanyl-D-alanine endopeptidase [unclassified Modestobacter]|uniref:D-alanyl-D-alanine carboxypeptidase/D-alanyl-D-alanine endopeptidase n=1 Tax=unclassified Modestobacter TaxID=2643866 RepID=UPI0022AA9BC2|nr:MULTISPECIES: D-alanyl-D-alanine carboxypeptidase/D-alanyl-D-alanine-endopeptidase [unclassified Modestobacter]MCZ2826177.1 D-alanyl-D-alanine carboxypeptidase/D-alanyl-D-alanine-endopeptidase [Modestobacter sp. VKM Ac-2981]MCZ2852758.1 D-alanyl-D-alanine carboxypeptidase/D-alanyl-D-alanine-endopeptidase [Modestobacter sp. VKM Ac-2982]
MKRRVAALPLFVSAAVLVASPSSAGSATRPGGGPGIGAQVGELPAAAVAIMSRPEYDTARWLYSVAEADTGRVVLAGRAGEFVFTASTAKNFTVGTAYATLGTDTTLTTPVYATAEPVGGVVAGDLVLVASGDLTMGGRGAMSGRVDHTFTADTIDHVYGDIAPNAALVPDDPLAGLDDLARQVAATGVTDVAGDVVVDTRLWETFDGQEGPAPSIYVNDNILDITVTAAGIGQPAVLDLRPQTRAVTVESTVTTTDAATPTALTVTADPGDPTSVTVSGTIAAGESQLTIHRVPDAASWARTLFVEALGRAGVTVTTPAVGPNDQAALPPAGPYPAGQRVAALTSPPLSALGRMILETSYNTGANALMCLLAVHGGSTDCIDGLAAVHHQLALAGVDTDDVVLFDGQGADPASTTPDQMVTWLRWAQTQPWGEELATGQPVLGVSGTLASTGQGGPAAGQVAAKTGTSVDVDPTTGRIYYEVQSLAGYLTTERGERLVFSLSMSGATYADLPTGLHQANEDVAAVAAAFQQAL